MAILNNTLNSRKGLLGKSNIFFCHQTFGAVSEITVICHLLQLLHLIHEMSATDCA